MTAVELYDTVIKLRLLIAAFSLHALASRLVCARGASSTRPAMKRRG